MKKRIKYRKIVISWILINLGLLVTVTVLYLKTFYQLSWQVNDMHLQADKDEWILFSNFLNNLLNPLLLSANIFFLIKLTYEVADNTQRNILGEMKQNAYMSLCNKLYSFSTIIYNSKNKKIDLLILKDEITSQSLSISHLLEFDNNDKIYSLIKELIKIANCKYITNSDLIYSEMSEEFIEFVTLCENFNVYRTRYITELQSLIIYNE